MTLPADAELLGIAPGPLALIGTGARATVPFEPGPHRHLLARAREAKGAPSYRISLCLEHIRGTCDGAVLHVAVGLPGDAVPIQRRTPDAEPVALYGLRRASLRREQRPGAGLTAIVDVTAAISRLPIIRSLAVDTLHVTIYPAAPLPEPVDIVIGRVVLFWQKF